MEVVDSLDVKNKISKMRTAGCWAGRRQSARVWPRLFPLLNCLSDRPTVQVEDGGVGKIVISF